MKQGNSDDLSLLFSKYDLSERAKNAVLRSSFINDTKSFLEFFDEKRNYLDLRNCGAKTNKELIEVAKDLKLKLNNQDSESSFDYGSYNIKNEHISTINNFLLSKINSSNDEFKKIFESYSFTPLEFLSKENELFTKHINNKNNNDILYELNSLRKFTTKLLDKYESNDVFSVRQYVIEDTLSSFYNIDDPNFLNSDLTNIFRLCHELIDKSIIYNNTEKHIVENYLKYFKDTPTKTLDEVGEELNLTRERVRQIRNKILKSFSGKFKFLSITNGYFRLLEKYPINFDKEYVVVTDDLTRRINDNDKTKFSALFIGKILSLLKLNFTLIGYELNYHTGQTSKKFPDLSAVYIVKRTLISRFDIKNFLTETREKFENGINETYNIGLKAYLSKFIVDFDLQSDLEYLETLVPFCKELVFNETQATIDGDNSIVFRRNRKRLQSQIIKEALENLGFDKEGHHITDIAKEIELIAPERDLHNKISSIRSVLNREKQTFLYLGRNSTYGLRIWEDIHKEFKGGTIRQIVREYLEGCDKPRHISQITKFVNKYRDTNENNVYGNILLDESSKFKIFPHRFIGLNSKSYKEADTDFNKVLGGYFTLSNLKKYLPSYYDDLLRIMAEDLDLKTVQVRSIIDGKIEKGSLIKSENGIIKLPN